MGIPKILALINTRKKYKVLECCHTLFLQNLHLNKYLCTFLLSRIHCLSDALSRRIIQERIQSQHTLKYQTIISDDQHFSCSIGEQMPAMVVKPEHLSYISASNKKEFL